jgi:5'(3')-deoxyribonucleotidase
MRIILDCDEVLADFVGAYLGAIQWVTGREHTREEVTGWDICGVLGVTPEEREKVNALVDYDFCRALKPLPGAQVGFETLCNESLAEIYIVTSPWDCIGWTHAREAWLKEHFGIDRKRVLHGSAKHLCDADLFVDDRLDNVAAWQAEHPYAMAVLWSQPWNYNENWNGIRTKSWSDLVNLVRLH